MEEKQLHDDLASIRNLMERSSKFISLSGLSGILAGVYALAGAAFAYYIIYSSDRTGQRHHLYDGEQSELVGAALLVLVASLVTGYIFTVKKAKRRSQPVWGTASKAVLFNMAIPLIAGGLLILVHVYRGHYGLVSPSCLVFYGLALVAASNFTFKDVRYLGLSEIVLGIIAACFPGYGLLFWAIGFGVLHIIYGSAMYLKYDR